MENEKPKVITEYTPLRDIRYTFQRTEEYAIGVDGSFSKDGKWRYFKTLADAELYIKKQLKQREVEKGSYLSLKLGRRAFILKEKEKIGVLSAEDMKKLGYKWDKDKKTWVLQ